MLGLHSREWNNGPWIIGWKQQNLLFKNKQSTCQFLQIKDSLSFSTHHPQPFNILLTREPLTTGR